MVDVAQLVRAPDCGSGGRRFEPDLPPLNRKHLHFVGAFLVSMVSLKKRVNLQHQIQKLTYL